MKALIVVAMLCALLPVTAVAQHPQMHSYERLVTTAYDSFYVLVPYGGLKVNLYNWSADTLKYFFGKLKSDSSSAILYKIYPSQGNAIEIPVAGNNFKAVFVKSTKSTAASDLMQLEQFPYEEK